MRSSTFHALLPAVREHIDAQSLHKVTQTIPSVVQMGNQYIDVQAPWSLRKTDTERMATVLWVLLESMRFVGILYQPVVPSISAALLDQLGVPHDRRSFAALAPGNELVGGAPLPTPAIIIPRYEKEEDAAPPPPPTPKAKKKAKKEQKPLSPAAAAQAAEVRRLKEEEGLGNSDPRVEAAVAELLRLKAEA